mgnify:CR=1 FL=1
MKMKTKAIICSALFLFICAQGVAQDTSLSPQIEARPLLTVTGRVISKGKDIMLITAEGKSYLLKETETLEGMFDRVRELANKDADITLSAFDTRETREFRYFNHKTKKARAESYRILRVALIHKVEAGSRVTDLDTSKPIDYKPLPKEVVPLLKQLRGKISKCNFRSVIPTIEIEGKPGLVIMFSADTQAIRAAGDELIIFKPRDVLKEGNEVEIWYEEKGSQNIARIITILEKLY